MDRRPFGNNILKVKDNQSNFKVEVNFSHHLYPLFAIISIQ